MVSYEDAALECTFPFVQKQSGSRAASWTVHLVQSKSSTLLTKLIWQPLIQGGFLYPDYNGQFVHEIVKYALTHIHPLYL